MLETIKEFKILSEFLDQFDGKDKDSKALGWVGPGWYYMSPDYNWWGVFPTKEQAEKYRDYNLKLPRW